MLNNEFKPENQCAQTDLSPECKNLTEQGFIIVDVRKNSRSFKKTLAIIVVCAVLSFSSAFAGATIGNSMSATSGLDDISSGINSPSVIQTSDYATVSVELSIPDIAELVSVSVVEISTETAVMGGRMRQFVSQGAGSGVIISAYGYIVTNYHVIDGASKISVRLSDGNNYDAKVIGKDEQTDLAVLKIETSGLTPVVYGESSKLRVGELAVAIGNPLGELGGTVTDGIISALGREIIIDGKSMTLLQTNAAINPGNSGGGLFNSAGELIGIVNAKSSGSDVEGLGFAIPIDTAKQVISELMKNGYVSGRPSLGVTLIDISNTVTAMRYRVSQIGVYVWQTESDSLFESGDLIKSIDGKIVNTAAEVISEIGKHDIGSQITVAVMRNNKELTLNVGIKEKVN